MLAPGKRGSALGRASKTRTKDAPSADATPVKVPLRGKLSAPLEATAANSGPKKSEVSPKNGGGGNFKGKSLALDGLKGPKSPQQESPKFPKSQVEPGTLERAKVGSRVSPRGKALSEASAAGGLRPKVEPPNAGGGSAGGDQARALASLHERHVSLQQEHATLQQAHKDLQAKHRDSVGSCLVLLDQLKELRGENGGDVTPDRNAPGSARAAFGQRPAVDRALEKLQQQTGGGGGMGGGASASSSSSSVSSSARPKKLEPSLHGAAHSAPPHKQHTTPGQAHAASMGDSANSSFVVPHPLRLPDERSMASDSSARGWAGGGQGGAVSNRSSQKGSARRNGPRGASPRSSGLVVNGRGTHAASSESVSSQPHQRTPRGGSGRAVGGAHTKGGLRRGGGADPLALTSSSAADGDYGDSQYSYAGGGNGDMGDGEEEMYYEEEEDVLDTYDPSESSQHGHHSQYPHSHHGGGAHGYGGPGGPHGGGYEYDDDGFYGEDDGVYDDDEFEEDDLDHPSEAGMSSHHSDHRGGGWGGGNGGSRHGNELDRDGLPYDDDGVEEEGEEGLLDYHDGYDDEDEDDPDDVSRLSPHDVEQLVEKYMQVRRRADDLENENAKLTQQLMELGQSSTCPPETLVIHVSPEMW